MRCEMSGMLVFSVLTRARACSVARCDALLEAHATHAVCLCLHAVTIRMVVGGQLHSPSCVLCSFQNVVLVCAHF